jgi:D-3-phosphoglycerate dehydrogenase
VEAEKKRFAGHEIAGRTLGVLGLGAIGSRVAEMALQLGMQVVGFDPALSVEAAWRLPSQVQRMPNMQALFSRSDMVTLHVPALESTRNLINRDALGYFRKDATLLNFARQDIVNATDLREALTQGRLRGYFSDFPVPELMGVAGAHATPHLGASTAEAEENCALMVADQLIDFLRNGNIRNSVNFPEVYLERTEGHRLALANRNVPRILGKVLSILADQNINVIDMLNKSRDEVAYNLIDIAVPPSPDVLSRIAAIDEVINVKFIQESVGPR